MEVLNEVMEILGKPLIGPLNGFHFIIFAIYLLLQLFKTSGNQVQASHILVSTENECKQIKEKLDDGQNFEDLAREHSKCPSGKSGGDLGKFGKGAMVPEFDAVCFDENSKVGDVLGPVKTQFGFHLVKIVSKETPETAKEK